MDKKIIEDYKKRFETVASPQDHTEWEEHNRLSPVINLINNYEELLKQKADTITLSQQEEGELKELALLEIEQLDTKIAETEDNLQTEIKKENDRPDPNDSKNAILEIRAGAGGEEAALFAADLFRMYSQYATNNNLHVQILDRHLAESGGLKELIAVIEGKDAYGRLKFESGVHRVQRVPTTESSGRIHTSTASVAILPQAEEVDLQIDPSELRIEAMRAGGAGGQCVNKTESAIRITHIPTNIVVHSQEGKSQHQNREVAMNILRSRLLDLKIEQEQKERSDLRRDKIGAAMRSEKIRTYNFPQDRITDHRIKKSWHSIETILNGDLEDILTSVKESLINES